MKIKINNNIKKQISSLYEDDNNANNSNNTSTNEQKAPAFSDVFKELVGSKFDNDIASNNLLFSFNIPNELYDAIEVPTAPYAYKGLMTDLGTPGKFKNTHNMIPDPTRSLNETQDNAAKYFSNVVFDLTTPSTIIKGMKSEEKSEDEKTAEKTAEEATSSETSETPNEEGSANESYSMNEGIFDHLLTGRKTNKDLKAETENKFSNASQNKMSKQTSASVAINNYLQMLTKDIKSLLLISVPKSNRSKTNELVKRLTYYIRHTESEVKNYIKSNDDFLQKNRDYAVKEAKNKQYELENLVREKIDAVKKLNANDSLTKGNKEEIINSILNARTSQALDTVINKANTKYKTNLSANISDDIDESVLFEGEENQTDNQADNQEQVQEQREFKRPEAKVGEKTFSEYYNTILQDLQRFMEEMMSGEPTDIEDVVTAKKQMQELKAAASDEIKKRIDIICRTNGGSDASSKIAAFLSKHPLRAEGLKRLWAQHEKDLELRIENRIKKITDYKGGLGYCNDILTKTVPQLYATLLTYKAIILYLEDANCYCVTKNVKETFKQPEEAVDNTCEQIIELVKTVFETFGNTLTKDNSDFIKDGQIVNTEVPYLGSFLYNYATTTQYQISYKNINKCNEELNAIKEQITNKNINSFAEAIANFMINHGAGLDVILNSDILTKQLDINFKQDLNACYDTFNKIIQTMNDQSAPFTMNDLKYAIASYYEGTNYTELSKASKENKKFKAEEITKIVKTPSEVNLRKANKTAEDFVIKDNTADRTYTLLNLYYNLDLKPDNSNDSFSEKLKVLNNLLNDISNSMNIVIQSNDREIAPLKELRDSFNNLYEDTNAQESLYAIANFANYKIDKKNQVFDISNENKQKKDHIEEILNAFSIGQKDKINEYLNKEITLEKFNNAFTIFGFKDFFTFAIGDDDFKKISNKDIDKISENIETIKLGIKTILTNLAESKNKKKSEISNEISDEELLSKMLEEEKAEKEKILLEIGNSLKDTNRWDMQTLFEILYDIIKNQKTLDSSKYPEQYNNQKIAINQVINIINTASDKKYVDINNIEKFCEDIASSGVVPTVLSIVKTIAAALNSSPNDINILKVSNEIVGKLLLINNIDGTMLASVISEQ